MKIKWNKLLLLASIVWGAAGINILKIGAEAYATNALPLNFLLSLLVFTIFHALIFNKLVKKHTSRIEGYTEELQFFLKFFDLKSFAIMAVMMTGGIGLRMSGAVPERFIAVFLHRTRFSAPARWSHVRPQLSKNNAPPQTLTHSSSPLCKEAKNAALQVQKRTKITHRPRCTIAHHSSSPLCRCAAMQKARPIGRAF